MTRVTLMVDARATSDDFLPKGDVGRLINLWQDFEPQLYGFALKSGQELRLKPLDKEGRELGTVVVTVAHPVRAPITPDTEFQIVSVLERPHIAQTYRCATCERDGQVTYGPFTCRRCSKDQARVCDNHVRLLPGSLEGTCPQHAPRCHCGQPGTGYCTGSGCKSTKAWCATHLRVRGSAAYCAECYEAMFPACSSSGCEAVGSLACQHVDTIGRFCGRHVCPRHATSWQIFGPERPGLIRCELHSAVMRQGPDEMVFQILANAVLQKDTGVPRIAGFRYILAKPGLMNPTEPQAYAYVLRSPQVSPALQLPIEQVIQRNRSRWDREINEGASALEAALVRLRSWMQSNGSVSALPTLEGLKWLPAKADRQETLLIRVDARYFNYQTRLRAEQSLGFRIQVKREN